jgi:hypothetical protein
VALPRVRPTTAIVFTLSPIIRMNGKLVAYVVTPAVSFPLSILINGSWSRFEKEGSTQQCSE